MEQFYTTEQVAKFLQVHPFTILKFIREGKLKGVKIGRVYRIMESDMTTFLHERMTIKTSKAEKPQNDKPRENAEEVIDEQTVQVINQTKDGIFSINHDNLSAPSNEPNDPYYII